MARLTVYRPAAHAAVTALVVVASMAAGAALMFFLDPDSGRRRRAIVRDKSRHYARLAQEREQGLLRHAANRAQGAMAALRATVHPEEIIEDAVLVERVRAALGHIVHDPLSVDLRVRSGIVTLKGPVREDLAGEILACVQHVRGVMAVENRMSINEDAGTPGGERPWAANSSYPDGIAR